MKELLRGLQQNRAFTDPESDDPRLVGRTYAIPFEAVWQASIGLGGGGLRGWSIAGADDRSGIIRTVVRGATLRPEIRVRIRIGLDRDAQTRVDLAAVAEGSKRDLGRCRRMIEHFLKSLDHRLSAESPSSWAPPASPPFDRTG